MGVEKKKYRVNPSQKLPIKYLTSKQIGVL